MTKINLKFILLSIFLSISLPAFADDSSVSNCGMLQDGKAVDGHNSDICAQDKAAQIINSFYGKASFAFRGSLDGINNQEMQDVKTDIQKEQDEKNQRAVGISNEYLLKITMICVFVFFCIMVGIGLWHKMKGDLNNDGEEAKKNPILSFIIMLGMFCLHWPTWLGVSIVQFILLGALNGGFKGGVFIIGNFLNYLGAPDLEYVKAGESSTDAQFQNGETMAKAEAITFSVAQRSVQLMMTSQAYNTNTNLLKDENFKLYDYFSEIITDKGNKWSFMKMNPEMPNQKHYNLAGYEFFNAPLAGAKTDKYLKTISYYDTYRVHDDVKEIANDAENIKRDLLVATKENGDEAYTYQSLVDSTMLIYFYDVRSNITAKTVKEFMLSQDAKDLAFAFLSAACSERPKLRMESNEYIKARKYTPVCVDANWKVAGEGKKEDYEKIIQDKMNILKDKIFNDLLAINTAYHNSLDTPERSDAMKKIRQEGILSFFLNLGELVTDTIGNATSQNNFQNQPFFNIFSPSIGDSYIEDEWLKNQRGFQDSAYPLQIGEYMKVYFKGVIATSISTPVQDAQTTLQTELIAGSAKTVQLDNFERANSLAMENIGLTLQRNFASSQMPLVGLADIGMQMIQTGQNGIFTVLAATVVGSGVDKIINAKRATNTKETAGVGKKVDNKRTKGQFSFFTKLFKYVAQIVIPAMSVLIGFGALFAYLLPLLMKYPFFLIYVLFLFYAIMLIMFSVLGAINAAKWHTWKSFSAYIAHLWRIVVVFTLFTPFMIFAQMMNWFMCGPLLKMVYTVMAFNYVDAVSQTTGLFGTTLVTIAMLFIAMWITTLASIHTTLSIIIQFLRIYRQDLVFADLIVNSLEVFIKILNVASMGFTFLLSKAMEGIYRK